MISSEVSISRATDSTIESDADTLFEDLDYDEEIRVPMEASSSLLRAQAVERSNLPAGRIVRTTPPFILS